MDGYWFFICLMRTFSRHKLTFNTCIITNDLFLLFRTHWWYQIADIAKKLFFFVECDNRQTFFFLCSSFSDSESDAITWNNHQLINAMIWILGELKLSVEKGGFIIYPLLFLLLQENKFISWVIRYVLEVEFPWVDVEASKLCGQA